MKKIFVLMIMVLMISGISFSAVYEDFEDGDVINNPTWTVAHDVGGEMIISDSLRPGNHAYIGYGTNTAHRVLQTTVDDISWEEFDLSMEFMATEDYISVKYELYNDTYQMGVGVWYDNRSPGYTDYLVLGIEENGSYNSDSWALAPWSEFSYSKWYKLHSWYDVQSNQFKTELKLLETDQLIAQASRTPTVDYSTEVAINSTSFGVEEIDWQYIDNFVLVPEPATLSLLALGGLLLRRKRNPVI